MSGWYLALHRHWHLNDSVDDTFRDTLLGMIWTTSTTTFHNLWYGASSNLPHGLLRNPFLRDHFDTSHNLLLDLRDCHVHNSFRSDIEHPTKGKEKENDKSLNPESRTSAFQASYLCEEVAEGGLGPCDSVERAGRGRVAHRKVEVEEADGSKQREERVCIVDLSTIAPPFWAGVRVDGLMAKRVAESHL